MGLLLVPSKQAKLLREAEEFFAGDGERLAGQLVVAGEKLPQEGSGQGGGLCVCE